MLLIGESIIYNNTKEVLMERVKNDYETILLDDGMLSVFIYDIPKEVYEAHKVHVSNFFEDKEKLAILTSLDHNRIYDKINTLIDKAFNLFNTEKLSVRFDRTFNDSEYSIPTLIYKVLSNNYQILSDDNEINGRTVITIERRQ